MYLISDRYFWTAKWLYVFQLFIVLGELSWDHQLHLHVLSVLLVFWTRTASIALVVHSSAIFLAGSAKRLRRPLGPARRGLVDWFFLVIFTDCDWWPYRRFDNAHRLNFRLYFYILALFIVVFWRFLSIIHGILFFSSLLGLSWLFFFFHLNRFLLGFNIFFFFLFILLLIFFFHLGTTFLFGFDLSFIWKMNFLSFFHLDQPFFFIIIDWVLDEGFNTF